MEKIIEIKLYYQAIRDIDNTSVSFGDPTALSIEPLLIWLAKLMEAYGKAQLN